MRAWTSRRKPAFAQLLEAIERAGVTLVTRRTSAAVEAMERAIGNATAVASGITGWENRWGTRNLVDQHPDGVSERAKAVLAKSEAMSISDYRALLLEREVAQVTHASVANVADAAITLACPGPAPLWPGDKPGQPLLPRPTGDAVFNYPSSMLFAPVVTDAADGGRRHAGGAADHGAAVAGRAHHRHGAMDCRQVAPVVVG